MSKSKSKIALVTGAAKRIGRAIALDLAAHNYQIAVHYNSSKKEANKLTQEIITLGGVAQPFQANLSDELAAQKLVSHVIEKMGALDVLVNNASIFVKEDWPDVTKASWDNHMNVNLRAPFILMQQMALALSQDQQGAIVNIIDQRVLNLNPHFVGYTLAKSGLWTLTQTMAQALAPNIRVNAIGPGPTLPSCRQKKTDFRAQFENIPMQSQVSLADICDALRYLITAKSVIGQMILVDGGEHFGWTQAGCGFSANE